MKNFIFILIIFIVMLVFDNNQSKSQSFKIVTKSWFSTEMFTDYITFLNNEKMRYSNFSYSNPSLISDFRKILNNSVKHSKKKEQGLYSKKNADINIAILLSDNYGKDTIAFDNFLRYTLINSDFYDFDWSILAYIRYKLPFATNNEIDVLYLNYYNSKRED